MRHGLGLRHGLEAWGREGWLVLRHGGEIWLGLNNGKKRYSVRLENKSQTISHFLAPLGNERLFEIFLRFVFKFSQLPLFFPLLSPSHPSLPHALSSCLKPSPSSSPCLKPMPSPCLKRMPQAHASLPQPSPSSMLQAQTPLPSLISSPCTSADAAGRAEMCARGV